MLHNSKKAENEKNDRKNNNLLDKHNLKTLVRESKAWHLATEFFQF